MPINSKNTINENIDDKKKNVVDIKDQFITSFVKEKLITDKVTFIDDVMNNPSITAIPNLEEDMKKFVSYNDKFKNVKIKDINIFDLRRAVSKDFLKLKNARNIFLWNVVENYDISKSDTDKVSNKIDSLTVEELYVLINSEKKTSDYLNKILPNLKLKDKKNTFNFLNILSESEINSRLHKIENKYWINKKQEVESILFDISTNRVIDSDIRTLFELDFFKDDEKMELVEKFIPTIDLEKLVEIWVLDKSKANELKEKLVKKTLSWEWLTDAQIDSIVDSTWLSDITLLAKDFFAYNNSVDLIAANVWFANLENDYKNIINEVSQNLKDNWPQKFDELILSLKELGKTWNIKNIEKFKKWSIFSFSSNTNAWEEKKSYFYINSIDDNKKELWLKLIWEWNSISSNYSSMDTYFKSYFEFLSLLNSKKWSSLEFFTKEEIENKLSSSDDKLTNFDYVRHNASDVQNNKSNLESDYVDWLRNEIESLKSEFASKKDDKQLEKLIKQKEELLDSYTSSNRDEDLLNLVNFKKFTDKLDEYDSDWKKVWFEKWIFIETEKYTYEVIWLDKDKWNINLKSLAWIENISFEVFINSFKKNKAKRVARINDFQNLINHKKTSEDSEKWSGIDFSSWKLIAKWVDKEWKKSDENIEFLTSEKNNELIKINDISWNSVRIQFWKRKDFSDLDKKEKKEDKIKDNDKWEKIYLEKNVYTVTINDLDKYIRSMELSPNWKTWKNITQKPDDLHNDFHWKLSSKIFNNFSFNELLSWWNMLLESLKESMKKWNDLHAAKFANKLWFFLPDEIKNDLLIKVERAESEEMDKALESLWKVDSPIAVKRIKGWLLNKDTPEYKKEAWLLFMLDKYGHLAAKWALYDFRWKWLWYEALGWRVNDEMFLELKAEAEKSNITFSEEYLVHMLLKDQCAKRKKPFRRSRLHKEYENKWKSWINAEIEKWYWDASNKRTAADMVKWWNGEALWWTSSNAVWWYKKSIERWWSLEDMSEWFFGLMFSWSLYHIDQATFTKIKALWDWDWMPMIIARMSSTKSDMELFNRVVVDLCKKIEKAYWKEFDWVWALAEKLFKSALEWDEKTEKQRFSDAISLWKKCWTPLVRALNVANLPDKTYSKTDKTILLEKESNNDYNAYFDRIRWYSDEIEFKEELMTDWFQWAWVTWLSPYQVARKTLKMHQSWGFMKDKNWKACWAELSNDINSVKDKILDLNSNDINSQGNREAQRKYLLEVLREIIAAFIENSWWNPRMMWAYNMLTTDIWQDLNKWWIDLARDFATFSPKNILEKNADRIILSKIDNILWWHWGNDNNFYNPFDDIQNSAKNKIDETLIN